MPIELNFSIDGISGLAIAETFKVQDQVLPERYRGKVGFIIKSLDHKIENNQWLTDITGIMFITEPVTKINDLPDIAEFIEEQLVPDKVESISAGDLEETPRLRYPLGTSRKIRSDESGDGSFGASRGRRIHKAIDLEAEPGDPVYAPISGNGKGGGYLIIEGTDSQEGDYSKWRFAIGYATIKKSLLQIMKDNNANSTEVVFGEVIGFTNFMAIGTYLGHGQFDKSQQVANAGGSKKRVANLKKAFEIKQNGYKYKNALGGTVVAYGLDKDNRAMRNHLHVKAQYEVDGKLKIFNLTNYPNFV